MATEAQRRMFQPDPDMLGRSEAINHNAEKRATKLREWYRIGQAYFRGFVDPSLHINRLNDALQMLSNKDDVEREGFLMGWQSDVYAYEHGLDYSAEGMDHVAQEDNDHGYFK